MPLKIFQLSFISLFLLMSFYCNSVLANASNDISIEHAYIRAVPPGQDNSAAFMQLINSSDKKQTIVNARSNIAEVVELHTHIHADGMMKMRRIEKIDIPAMGNTTLQPGGLHIMLIKLHHDLKIGQEVLLTIEFSDGSTKTINVPVQKINVNSMMMQKMKE
jgi:copper(I)-binding protein